MKKIILTAIIAACISPAFGQKYMTRTGKISFFSSTPIENIEAFNNESAAVVNSATGEIAFQVPVKSFKFEKQLMEDHFNENYMESDKYPKAEFKGKIADPTAVKFKQNGTYNVKVAGKLTIHGVTKDVMVPGTVVVKDNTITLNAKFNVKPADYSIKIPTVAAGKIADQIAVTIASVLKAI